MPQLPSIEVTDTPLKISDGLPTGCYIAQPVEPWSWDHAAPGVRYATTAGSEAPPADLADWFRCRGESYFEFTVGLHPTWVRVADPHRGPVTLALARR